MSAWRASLRYHDFRIRGRDGGAEGNDDRGRAGTAAWQKCGPGPRLMDAIIDCAREKLYRTMVGDVLADNQKMLNLMTRLGFTILPHPDSHELKRVVKSLRD